MTKSVARAALTRKFTCYRKACRKRAGVADVDAERDEIESEDEEGGLVQDVSSTLSF
jgi:hypothetical protein